MGARSGFERAIEQAVREAGELGQRIVARRDHLEATTGRSIPIDPTLEEDLAATEEDDARYDAKTPQEKLKSTQASYATFLDRPIPALLGMSLRQAAADRQLHPVVLSLLRSHEDGIGRMYGPDAVDFDAMRRELGLLN